MDTQQPNDETLSAWLDGELDESTRHAVEAWLHQHPEDAARVRLWAADREALRARFDPVLHEPVPEALQRKVREGGRGAAGSRWPAWTARPSWQMAAAAAGLVASGALIGGGLVWQFQQQQQAAAQGPSAQLMYQNRAGQRVTVYLRRPEPGSSTSFRYQREGELGMFYWAEEGYGCALVGKLPREKLLALAEAAYKQVEQDLPAARARPSS
jgi:anti-sigma factor RsiW